MAAQVTNYQCPACTGPVHFSPETGKVVCDYCGSVYELSEIEAIYAEKEAKAAEEGHAEATATGGDGTAKATEAKTGGKGAGACVPGVSDNPEGTAAEAPSEEEEDMREGTEYAGEWDTSSLGSDWGADAENMKVYQCPSCGAELICDSTTGATSCPYCGNPTVVPGQFSGALKPNFVIPFKIDKDAAIRALKNHYKGKFFLPGTFTSENHLQEIKGVYVPFWMFDGVAEASATYNATVTTVHRRGDEEITNTAHYRVRRAGKMAFEKIPVDASSKMPDAYMDSIEPYDYQELKEFSAAYLPGFLADKYDVAVDDSWERADQRCEETIKTALRNTTLGYQTCIPIREWVHMERGKVQYALLPVWLLTTKWNGENYLFAVNGQTGKVAGDLPVSKGKFWATFAGIAAGLSVIGSIAVTLFMM